MIVIGTDTHKQTHTASAVDAQTGQLAGELTAAARRPGFGELLDWSRSFGAARIWALEDCRHVSGGFERFLVAAGERVVRVPPKLMGASRKGERSSGKSDSIDALAVARAALRQGPESLPAAQLDERSLELKLLLDHREDLVSARTEDQQRLRWHLHDLWPDFEIPAGALDRLVWLDRVARRLARSEQIARVRISRELVRTIRDQTRRAAQLEREIGALVSAQAPELVELPGCGADRRQAGRRDRWRRALLIRRQARPPGGSRPDSRFLGQARPPPPRPRRQPPAQLRAASHRGHPGARPSASA
jgi:transposase